MKRSKRFLSLLLAVMVLLTTVVSATMVSTSAAAIDNSALCSEYYATNPNGVGKQATITIDGSFSDWSTDMLIAKGGAWDVANHYKGAHENCLLDTTGLFAAWDNENLYVAWQMVNTTDTWHREGDGSLSDGGRVLDVPLILALRVDPTKTPMSNRNNQSGPIWGQKMGLTFDTPVDHLLYMSGKPGLGEPAIFTAVDDQGNTNYTTGCRLFKAAGIEYKMAEGNIMDTIMGLNYSEDPADVTNAGADWVDYKTFKGSMGTHNTKYDSFYEIKIPLSVLGIDANYLTTNGIGAMVVATRGESALDCIPFDTTMLDNVMDDYGADASTSHEKDDEDVITVELAKIGKGGAIVNPPVTQPATTEPTTAAPVTTEPTTVAPVTTEPTEPLTTAPKTESTDSIIIPPVVTTAATEPSETSTTTPVIPVPTLDFGDDTTPTETTKDAETTTNAPVVVPTVGILGDADQNDLVNIKDATLIQKHLAKITTLSDDAQFLSDVDGNEILNIRDVTAIQKWLAKMDVDYAIGQPVQGEEIVIPVPTAVTTEATEVTTTAAPTVIVEPTTQAPETEPATTAAPTEATEVPTEPTTIVTEPVYTEPVYTEPIYTEPVYTDPTYPDAGTITIYFENTQGWSNVCWHAWNDAGATSTPWPGDAMTYVEGNVYSATISAEYTGIIFNDGTMEGAKSDDTIVGGDGQIFSGGSWSDYNGGYDGPIIGGGNTIYFSNNKGWSTVNAYTWADGIEGTWPGTPMTLVGQNDFSEDVYSFTVPDGHNMIIFNDGASQTVDINLNEYPQNGFYLTDQVDGKYAVGQYDYVG